jgi:hypothetical protein
MIGNPFESATFVGTGPGNVCVGLYLSESISAGGKTVNEMAKRFLAHIIHEFVTKP